MNSNLSDTIYQAVLKRVRLLLYGIEFWIKIWYTEFTNKSEFERDVPNG